MKAIPLFLAMQALLLPACLHAQTLRERFINMPDTLCLLLTHNNRADFVDFLDSRMRAQVKNKFERTSEMKTLTDDYLLIETTAASSLQMKLLPVNDSVQVIFMANTCKGPAEDTRLSVYSTDWEELPLEGFITLPVQADFMAASDTLDTRQRETALQRADIQLIKAEFAPDADTLAFTYTTVDYMEKEDAQALRPFLKAEALIYKWSDGRFRPGQ